MQAPTNETLKIMADLQKYLAVNKVNEIVFVDGDGKGITFKDEMLIDFITEGLQLMMRVTSDFKE